MPDAAELQRIYAEQVKAAFETDTVRPVKARCDDTHVIVELADGREIRAPLWWYPFLRGLDPDRLNTIELMYEGIWWDAVDEGISIKSMLLGWKAPGAKNPKAPSRHIK